VPGSHGATVAVAAAVTATPLSRRRSRPE